MKTHRILQFLALPTLFCQLSTHHACAQGSLTPPGVPAPTMKTLDQLEPRTPVNATTAPGSATALFTITQSGSYYLTGNIYGVAGRSGIHITAADVTLDLNGFAVIGVAGSVNGIETGPLISTVRVTLRNGTIAGWGNVGVYAATAGIDDTTRCEGLRIIGNGVNPPGGNPQRGGLYSAISCTATGCVFSHNTARGMAVAFDATVSRCVVNGNVNPIGANDAGIFVAAGTGRISECVAADNSNHGIWCDQGTIARCAVGRNTNGITAGSGSSITTAAVFSEFDLSDIGISTGEHCTISDCAVTGMVSAGISVKKGSHASQCNVSGGSDGAIRAEDHCQVAGCVATNASSDSPPGASQPYGINAGGYCQITGSLAFGNQETGIGTGTRSIITGCHVSDNNSGGIRTTGTGSRIEGNKVRDNTGTGILSSGGAGADFILNNLSGGNTTNYSPASGTGFGPLQTPAAGTSRWANF